MQIKTYKGKYIYQPHFFILNKGNNCGKPLTGACANCFVCLLQTEEEKDFCYWLCFALWQTGQFEPFLSGSVIPFIHIKDVRDVVHKATIQVNKKPQQYQKSLASIIDVDKQAKLLESQLKVLLQLKKTLLDKILK